MGLSFGVGGGGITNSGGGLTKTTSTARFTATTLGGRLDFGNSKRATTTARWAPALMAVQRSR
jgi:hypothetical protein